MYRKIILNCHSSGYFFYYYFFFFIDNCVNVIRPCNRGGREGVKGGFAVSAVLVVRCFLEHAYVCTHT